MASVVVTVRIMPASPEVDLASLEKKALADIQEFAGEGETKTEQVPIAFGLISVNIIFVMDENQGSPDPVAEKISEYEEVKSAEITDVRRAIG